jgi:hypothetical protein
MLNFRGFSLLRIASENASQSGQPCAVMDDDSTDRITLARKFLAPSNSTHRQYDALRAFFVDGLPSAEAAVRFGSGPPRLAKPFCQSVSRSPLVPRRTRVLQTTKRPWHPT